MPSLTLDLGDAGELAEMLSFISDLTAGHDEAQEECPATENQPPQ